MSSNTKTIGVAYADPLFDEITVSGPIVATGSVTGSTHVSTASSGAIASNAAGVGVYILSTAITNNVTTTTAPSGSLGITSNATGLGKLFYSNGTVWLFAAIT
jgi:hypothetical protein